MLVRAGRKAVPMPIMRLWSELPRMAACRSNVCIRSAACPAAVPVASCIFVSSSAYALASGPVVARANL
jgi:hypothetical protein